MNHNLLILAAFSALTVIAVSLMIVMQVESAEKEGQLYVRSMLNVPTEQRKELNHLNSLLKNSSDLDSVEIQKIKNQIVFIQEKSKNSSVQLSDQKRLEIKNHIDKLGSVMNRLYIEGSIPIVSVGTYEPDESVQIRILKDDLTTQKILEYEKHIRKIIGDKVNITIIPSDPIVLTVCEQTGNCEPLQPGAQIRVGLFGFCTMGVAASFEGQNGFVTAGHCNMFNIGGTGDNVGNPTFWPWDVVGTVYANSFENDSWCDCMFVNATEDISPIVFPDVQLDGLMYPNKGDFVYVEGMTTQGEGGQVVDNYQYFTTDLLGKSYTIKGAVQVDFMFAEGDSGGPVYEWKSDGIPKFAGIISGNTEGYGYYIPHYRITNEFPGLNFIFS